MYLFLVYSDEELSNEEKQRRHSNHYINDSTCHLSTDQQYKLSETVRHLLEIYAQKWDINKAILILNLNRLFSLLHQLLSNHFISQQQLDLDQISIDDWFTILEFYLQMDGSSSL